MSSSNDEEAGFPMTPSQESKDSVGFAESPAIDDEHFEPFCDDVEDFGEHAHSSDEPISVPASKKPRLEEGSSASVHSSRSDHHVTFRLEPEIIPTLQTWQLPLLIGMKHLRRMMFYT